MLMVGEMMQRNLSDDEVKSLWDSFSAEMKTELSKGPLCRKLSRLRQRFANGIRRTLAKARLRHKFEDVFDADETEQFLHAMEETTDESMHHFHQRKTDGIRLHCEAVLAHTMDEGNVLRQDELDTLLDDFQNRDQTQADQDRVK